MSYEKRSKTSLGRLAVSSLTSGLTSEAVISYYEALDCARSLTAAIMFRYEAYDQLVSLECDPSHYNTGESFRDAYLASSLLLRSKFLETGFDREELALIKFKFYEQNCAKTNARLNTYRSQTKEQATQFQSGVTWSVNEHLLSVMRRKVDKILGEFSPCEMYDLSSWGPGVSTSIKGEETFASKKFQQEAGITRDLHPLVVGTFPTAYPGWWTILEANENWPKFEVGNAIVTVPKTSKIDRVIAIEPGLNLWFQLGIGRMIRRRLGRVGIDLTDQGANQRAALRASRSGHLVTVDFSSASDSIAFELVRNLFSENANTERWFEVMDLVRSKYGVLNTKEVEKDCYIPFRWNKFSSMGNGFTFDLETLIFYVAAVAACEHCGVSSDEVSVYGDDVIVPTEAFSCFVSLSEYCGFTVNQTKSFSSGVFRESCGAHYFAGLDCKPLFLEEELNLPVRVYNFANTLRLRSKLPFYGCDGRFRRLFYKLVSFLPKELRFRVSAVENEQSKEIEPTEGGFISNFDEACPPKARHGIEGYSVKRLAWVSIKIDTDYPGHLLSRLTSITVPLTESPRTDLYHLKKGYVGWAVGFSKETKARRNANPLRGRTKCVVTYTLVRQWCDLGPWINP